MKKLNEGDTLTATDGRKFELVHCSIWYLGVKEERNLVLIVREIK